MGSDNKIATYTLVAIPLVELYLLKCPVSKNNSTDWVPQAQVSEPVGDAKGYIMKPVQERKEGRRWSGEEKREERREKNGKKLLNIRRQFSVINNPLSNWKSGSNTNATCNKNNTEQLWLVDVSCLCLITLPTLSSILALHNSFSILVWRSYFSSHWWGQAFPYFTFQLSVLSISRLNIVSIVY